MPPIGLRGVPKVNTVPDKVPAIKVFAPPSKYDATITSVSGLINCLIVSPLSTSCYVPIVIVVPETVAPRT